VAIASNFATGIILLLLCIFGEFIRRNTPGVALLSSISGIGFTYLALNEYLPVAASPIVSFLPFAIVMLGYFAGSKYRKIDFLENSFVFLLVKFGPVPVAFVALVVGTILGWATSLNHAVDVRNATMVVKPYSLAFPLKEMFSHINEITPYLSTTIPTAISIAIGTIQCVESAKRAGDFYPTREAMFADGVGTLIASSFGSILGMTSKNIFNDVVILKGVLSFF
jgi:AGZA family xanthine/uracil permease-like MFS transporter